MTVICLYIYWPQTNTVSSTVCPEQKLMLAKNELLNCPLVDVLLYYHAKPKTGTEECEGSKLSNLCVGERNYSLTNMVQTKPSQHKNTLTVGSESGLFKHLTRTGNTWFSPALTPETHMRIIRNYWRPLVGISPSLWELLLTSLRAAGL